MEHLFTVAGHTFKLLLPERYLAAEWLAPYMPFRKNGGLNHYLHWK